MACSYPFGTDGAGGDTVRTVGPPAGALRFGGAEGGGVYIVLQHLRYRWLIRYYYYE